MRSDRRKQAEKKKLGFAGIGAIIYFIFALIFIISMWRVGIIPVKFEIIITAVVVIIAGLFSIPLRKKSHGPWSGFIAVIALLLSIILGIGSYYFLGTGNFFSTISNVDQTTDFYVVVRTDSDNESIEDIAGQTVRVSGHSDLMNQKAIKELTDKVDVSIETGGEYLEICNDLITSKADIIFVNGAFYDIAMEELDGFDEESVRIIGEITIKNESTIETSSKNITKEPFNVYITGIDTSGRISNTSRSDVNMVVTVDPVTRKILLTSIPRDYYVELANVGQMDKLTHSGLMGPEVTVQTVENLLGIDIDYYVKVNFSTVTSLVDILGGIDVNSDYAFTSKIGKYQFSQGMNHLNGDMALAFARERYAFSSGDRQRVKNQQAVIEAIIKKATSSSSILLKYNEILNALSDKMQTNMGGSDIKALVKMQLDDMSGWDINSISLDGSGLMTTTYYYPGSKVYVMVPDQSTVDAAKESINAVINRTETEEDSEN